MPGATMGTKIGVFCAVVGCLVILGLASLYVWWVPCNFSSSSFLNYSCINLPHCFLSGGSSGGRRKSSASCGVPLPMRPPHRRWPAPFPQGRGGCSNKCRSNFRGRCGRLKVRVDQGAAGCDLPDLRSHPAFHEHLEYADGAWVENHSYLSGEIMG